MVFSPLGKICAMLVSCSLATFHALPAEEFERIYGAFVEVLYELKEFETWHCEYEKFNQTEAPVELISDV